MTDHYVDVVNEKDEVIGKELKSRKSSLDFISRVVAIMIQNSDGRFVVCKRGSHKFLDAGKYDLAAFGSVVSGEDYNQAAARELKEELGITCSLDMLGKIYQEVQQHDGIHKIFCGIFLGKTDKEPRLNHELVSFRRMRANEIAEEMKSNPESFCQGFINDFNHIKSKLDFR